MKQRAIVGKRIKKWSKDLGGVGLLVVTSEHQRLETPTSHRKTKLGDGRNHNLGVGLLHTSELKALESAGRNRLDDRHQLALLELVIHQAEAVEILGRRQRATHGLGVALLGAEIVVANVHHHELLGQVAVEPDRRQNALEYQRRHSAVAKSKPRELLGLGRKLGDTRRDGSVNLVARDIERLDAPKRLDRQSLKQRREINSRVGDCQRLERRFRDERIQVRRHILGVSDFVARESQVLNHLTVKAIGR